MNAVARLLMKVALCLLMFLPTGCSDEYNDNSCTWAYDGACDEGLFGLCSNGTDCSDCGDCPDGGSSGGGECSNTCVTAYDGDCDDGRPGADYSICDYGTDCADCGGGSGGSGGSGGDCVDAGDYCSSSGDCCEGTCISNTGVCHDYCSYDSDCVSGCCAATDSGSGVCADPSYCAAKASGAALDSGLPGDKYAAPLSLAETCSADE